MNNIEYAQVAKKLTLDDQKNPQLKNLIFLDIVLEI